MDLFANAGPALRESLDEGVTFLSRYGAGEVRHSHGTFLDHLVGVAALLVDWGCADEVCRAGLFHAVYGTEAFPRPMVDPDERDVVRQVIGADAEQLVHLFERLDRDAFREGGGGVAATLDRESGSGLPTTAEDRVALAHLLVANWLEQAPGVAAKRTPSVVAQYLPLVPLLDERAAEAVERLAGAAR